MLTGPPPKFHGTRDILLALGVSPSAVHSPVPRRYPERDRTVAVGLPTSYAGSIPVAGSERGLLATFRGSPAGCPASYQTRTQSTSMSAG